MCSARIVEMLKRSVVAFRSAGVRSQCYNVKLLPASHYSFSGVASSAGQLPYTSSYNPIASAEAVSRAISGVDGLPRLQLVDCGSAAAYLRAHVVGAALLPIDASTKDSSRPLRVIPPTLFEAVAAKLGLETGVPAIVYDDGSTIAAARVWWTFSYYGHPAAILDGGWRAYIAAGGPIRSGVEEPAAPTSLEPVVASPREALLATLDDVLAATSSTKARDVQLVDARTLAEYCGDDKRGNRFGGHCPGATHLPHAEVLTPDRTFKSAGELEVLFKMRGLDGSRPTIVYCQGGMRAAIVMAAMLRAGFTDVRNYDGGSEEYNNVPGLPLIE